MKNYRKVLILICLFVLIPCCVFAYHTLFNDTGSTFVAERRFDLPVDFRVDSGGDINIVEDACDEWNDVDNIEDLCGDLDLTDVDIDEDNYEDLVSGNDRINDFIFDDTRLILLDLGFAPGVVGVSLNTFVVSTGEILESTVILNTGAPQGQSFDPLSTTVHELGHSWGLAHVPIGGINTAFAFPSGLDPISPSGIPTMFPFNIPTNDTLGRSLEFDDMSSLFFLYGD
ncbi:MAG: hypothetical protein ACRENO_09640 [Thermodesulfobacteriota bacterium]